MNYRCIYPVTPIILWILILSCHSSDHDILVDKHKIWIDIPGQYQAFSMDRINQTDKSGYTEEKRVLLNRLKNLSEKDKNLKIYLDTNNVLNYITITIGQYLEINKNTTQQLSDLTKSKLIRNYDFLDVQVRIMERSIKSGEHRYMKLKYKIDILNTAFYQTFYLVNSRYGTFGIAVVDKEGRDYEDMIIHMQVK